jgi:hypothetical protein
MDNIKIIRLQSGEDIIAAYKEERDEGTVLLGNPMTLLFKRLPTGKAVMLMSPWLPTELIESNAAWLYTDDILSIMQPKKHLIDYYNDSVRELEVEMLSMSKDVEDSLSDPQCLDDCMEDEEEESLEEEELRKEMESLREEVKKRILH